LSSRVYRYQNGIEIRTMFTWKSNHRGACGSLPERALVPRKLCFGRVYPIPSWKGRPDRSVHRRCNLIPQPQTRLDPICGARSTILSSFLNGDRIREPGAGDHRNSRASQAKCPQSYEQRRHLKHGLGRAGSWDAIGYKPGHSRKPNSSGIRAGGVGCKLHFSTS